MVAPYLNVMDFGAIGDGVADDRVAIQSAINSAKGKRVYLPAAKYRVSTGLVAYTSDTNIFAPGPNLFGDHMLGTTLHCDSGPAVKLDSAGILYKYLLDASIERMTIEGQVSITAGWLANLSKVRIQGAAGDGLVVPWRPDLVVGISDPYQGVGISLDQCYIRANTGWGVNFGGGQSPGFWSARQCLFQGNGLGGVRSTTGQFELLYSLISESPTGMLIDTVEGPARVFRIEGIEFDSNTNVHLSIVRGTGGLIARNRFLTQPTTFVTPVHVSVGGGGEVSRCNFEQNEHRSPAGTSIAVVAYKNVGGANVTKNRLTNPRIDPNENSTGMVRDTGWTPGNIIVQD